MTIMTIAEAIDGVADLLVSDDEDQVQSYKVAAILRCIAFQANQALPPEYRPADILAKH